MQKIAKLGTLIFIEVLCSGCNLTRNFGEQGQYIRAFERDVHRKSWWRLDPHEKNSAPESDFLFEIKWDKYKKISGVRTDIMGKLENDLIFRNILDEELLKIKLCPNGYELAKNGVWGKSAIYSIQGFCK